MVASFIFAAGHFFNYLGVTTPVGLFTEYLLYPFGVNLAHNDINWYSTTPIISAFTFFILMIIIGAFIYTSLTGTFEIKLPSKTTNRVAEIIIAFAGGIILAIGARIAQGCSVGGFWSGLTGLSIFGVIFTIGMIPGTIAGYYTYVNLSSWASSLKKSKNVSSDSSSKIDNALSKYRNILNLVFGVVIGLILIGISLELPGLNANAAQTLKTQVLAQYQTVLLAWGIFVIIISFLIVGIRSYVLRR
ncbi:YeeE/YedE thiosulfate transporter family protein [Caldisphaera lagunensis]|uniref:YeeE/YedE thiosulfate transporter family protein n=1 Tax=Caldisphaera lagunensis TaxID=200415 RepID=UPI0006624A5D|nr:YeeE/YedE thiosulfate transporter family protein [Caldisphaera lagunensis]